MTPEDAKNTYQAVRRRLLVRLVPDEEIETDRRSVYELLTHLYHLDTRHQKDRELQDLAQVLDDVASAL